ncbi:MAG TPA: hypothetical protein VFG47_06120, partial [Geminicoccaceae bacterium]|nr:hypothetical protein [Geminicoccaceae bacterium]
AAMKAAAKDLLAILYGGRDEVPDLYVGYSTYKLTVSIGAHRTDWLTGYDPGKFAPTTWKGCVDARAAPYDQDDSPPSVMKWRPYRWPSGQEGNTWPPVKGNPETRGPNAGCNPNGVLPLTGNRAAVEAGIDALSTTSITGDGTNPTTGMVWGWRLVSPRWRGLWGGDTPDELPLAYADPDSDKAIILLTDGETNFPSDSRTPYGFLNEGLLGTKNKKKADEELNRRLVNICSAVKENGIEVYTIMFQINDKELEKVYRACASSSDHYFKSATNDDLRRAFRAIGGKLSNLRVTK